MSGVTAFENEAPIGLLTLQVDNYQFHLEVRRGTASTTLPLSLPLKEVPQFNPEGNEEKQGSGSEAAAESEAKPTTQPELTIQPSLVLEFSDKRKIDLKTGEFFGAMSTPSREEAPPPHKRLPVPVQLPIPSENTEQVEEEPPMFRCPAMFLTADEFMTTVGRLYPLCKSLYKKEAFEAASCMEPVGPWESVTFQPREGAQFTECEVRLEEIAAFRQKVLNYRHAVASKCGLTVPVVAAPTSAFIPMLSEASSSAPAKTSPLTPQEMGSVWQFCATPASRKATVPPCAQKCPIVKAAIKALVSEGNFDIKTLTDEVKKNKDVQDDGSVHSLLPLKVISLGGNPTRLRSQMDEFAASHETVPNEFDWCVLRLCAAIGTAELDAYFDDAFKVLKDVTSTNPTQAARHCLETAFLGHILQRPIQWHQFHAVLSAILLCNEKKNSLSHRWKRKVQLVALFIGQRLGVSQEELQELSMEILGTFSADGEAFQKEENSFQDLPCPRNGLELVDALVTTTNKTCIFYWYGVFMQMIGKDDHARHLFTVGTRLSPPSISVVTALREQFMKIYKFQDNKVVFSPLGAIDDSFDVFRGCRHWQTMFARLKLVSDFRKQHKVGFHVERLQDHIGMLTDLPATLPGSAVNSPFTFVNAVCASLLMASEGLSSNQLKKKGDVHNALQPHLMLAEGILNNLRKAAEAKGAMTEVLFLASLQAKLKYSTSNAFREGDSHNNLIIEGLEMLSGLSDRDTFVLAPGEAVVSRHQLLRDAIGNMFSTNATLWEGITLQNGGLSISGAPFVDAVMSTKTGDVALLAREIGGFVNITETNQPEGFAASCENFLALAGAGCPHILVPWHMAYIERSNVGVCFSHRYLSAKSLLEATEGDALQMTCLNRFALHTVKALQTMHGMGLAYNTPLTPEVIVAPFGNAERFMLLATGDETRVENYLPSRPAEELHKPVPAEHKTVAASKLAEKQVENFHELGQLLESLMPSGKETSSLRALVEVLKAPQSEKKHLAVSDACAALCI